MSPLLCCQNEVTEVTNWENSVCIFLVFRCFHDVKWQCLHTKSIRRASNSLQMLWMLYTYFWSESKSDGEQKTTWQVRYEHEAYSQFLIEKLVQQNSPRYNLVTSGKKGSNNVHLIIASHNFSDASQQQHRERNFWMKLNPSEHKTFDHEAWINCTRRHTHTQIHPERVTALRPHFSDAFRIVHSHRAEWWASQLSLLRCSSRVPMTYTQHTHWRAGARIKIKGTNNKRR